MMNDKKKSQTLAEVRNNIDHIDIEIIKLLKKRTEHVLLSRRLKKNIEDTSREAEVLQTVGRCADSILEKNFLQNLFINIMTESKRQQEKSLVLAGFAGEHGAYAENAIRSWNPNWLALPEKEQDKLLERTADGVYDYAILPIESTLGGVDRLSSSLLYGCKLKICGAVDLQIDHCLLTLPQTSYRDIREVYSHPQAVNQCREFIKRLDLTVHSTSDTGGAASMLSEKQLPGVAVIAAKESAALYNLTIIKEQIQDKTVNRTRFLILGKDQQEKFPGKCSLFFDTELSLPALLKEISKSDLELVRIESYGNQHQTVSIFADFRVDSESDLKKLAIWLEDGIVSRVQNLGCYQELIV